MRGWGRTAQPLHGCRSQHCTAAGVCDVADGGSEEQLAWINGRARHCAAIGLRSDRGQEFVMHVMHGQESPLERGVKEVFHLCFTCVVVIR